MTACINVNGLSEIALSMGVWFTPLMIRSQYNCNCTSPLGLAKGGGGGGETKAKIGVS